jgi:hypothetical protein
MIFGAKRKGLGTLITAPLILVASIILGAGVIFLGGSMFQTNEEIEAIHLSNTHIWLSPNGTSTAAFVVQNSGGKPVAISSISIRGISTPLSQVWFNKVDATSTSIQTELAADYTENAVNIDGVAGEEAFALATGPVLLKQGEAAIIYLDDPASIDAIDAGLDMTLHVKAGKATGVLSSVHVVSS